MRIIFKCASVSFLSQGHLPIGWTLSQYQHFPHQWILVRLCVLPRRLSIQFGNCCQLILHPVRPRTTSICSHNASGAATRPRGLSTPVRPPPHSPRRRSFPCLRHDSRERKPPDNGHPCNWGQGAPSAIASMRHPLSKNCQPALLGDIHWLDRIFTRTGSGPERLGNQSNWCASGREFLK